MSEVVANGLAGAHSAYLRSARHQPVHWRAWGPEAFALAAGQNKPVLLDIGAVWCHWCHVMDRESYEDAETARIINEHFIAIKVDRDERPDVDARYQAAVAAISGQGGWPLTAFLTPDGRPFFGGTYFPPVDGHGRPSLRRVLMTMAESYEHRRDEVFDSAASVMAAIEHNESFDGSGPDPDNALLGRIVSSALAQFDPRYGGFGTQPKFPHPAALDLLLDTSGREGTDPQSCRHAVLLTLQKMSRGGIYDHLAGGFHRYSVDERWVVPHFEKMSYDNSELLRTYVHAYQSSGEPECARIARECLGWIDSTMSDREHGGFFGSQDADESLDDDGDYFTWTLDEAASVLTPEELAIAAPFYDIGELGDMHHNPQKNVLHVQRSLSEIAHQAAVPLDLAAARLLSARDKLHAARLRRPVPYIDQTLYTAWNAMMISAYLEAARVLDQPSARRFALRSLDRALGSAWNGHAVRHVIRYAEGSGPAPEIPGILDDYAFLAHAALDAWEAKGTMHLFSTALCIAESMLSRFFDPGQGGFFDTELPAPGELRLGALNTRRKPLQDSPTPAGNPVAASLLLRLHALTGRADLREQARRTLQSFAGVVEHFGLYAASYGLALRRLVEPSVQIVILGTGPEADRLERAALERYAVNKSVVRLPSSGDLPPALAETVPGLPGYREGRVQAMICLGSTCLPPVTDSAVLRAALRNPV